MRCGACLVIVATAACSRHPSPDPIETASPVHRPAPQSVPSVSTPAAVAPTASTIVRVVPFDGGAAHLEADPRGSEHVLLLAPDGGVLGESYCAWPIDGYDVVREFFTAARNAIVTGNVERTADLMAFPLRVNGPQSRLVKSREQFVIEHASILTRDVVERVRMADPGRVTPLCQRA